ncbi:hypothetical protein P171DRAFT_75299 [Karstenula rhodostoma CBS 690.94]|uniref:Uncharacterized protein n=1 Tax=Karstenula rhodostoma CBS 690.94 TaxID=1392251 RepID=A0A9P4PCL8_9PLEO|nr:hypothetical protein P171DRAFT_75299 [Karstenula rhodostoma CBS 690.94]
MYTLHSQSQDLGGVMRSRNQRASLRRYNELACNSPFERLFSVLVSYCIWSSSRRSACCVLRARSIRCRPKVSSGALRLVFDPLNLLYQEVLEVFWIVGILVDLREALLELVVLLTQLSEALSGPAFACCSILPSNSLGKHPVTRILKVIDTLQWKFAITLDFRKKNLYLFPQSVTPTSQFSSFAASVLGLVFRNVIHGLDFCSLVEVRLDVAQHGGSPVEVKLQPHSQYTNLHELVASQYSGKVPAPPSTLHLRRSPFE